MPVTPSGEPESADQPAQRGGTVRYSEKLWPSWWIWIVTAGISGAGILVFAPISTAAGITAALVLFTVLGSALVISTPAIVVTDETLTVGRATIPRELLDAPTAYTGDEATAERGVRLNATAYLCIRGWISPVVRIGIEDPADPTPYWLMSTRRPDHLVSALRG